MNKSFFFWYKSSKKLFFLYFLIVLISFALANMNIRKTPPSYLVSAVISYQNEMLEPIFSSLKNDTFKNCIENYSQSFAVEFLKSSEVSKILFENRELTRFFFISEWDPTAQRFEEPTNSRMKILISDLKYFLTGWRQPYIEPNVVRLKEKLTGFVTVFREDSFSPIYLRSKTLDPKASIKIMGVLVDAFNQAVIIKCKSRHFNREYDRGIVTEKSLTLKKAISERNSEIKFINLIFDERKIKVYDFITHPQVIEFSRKAKIITYYIYAFLSGTFVFLFLYLSARAFVFLEEYK